MIALGYNSFGEVFIMTNKIRECRKRKGLSQEELANKIGVKRAVVSKYEIGKISPRIDTVQNIARTLNVSIDELLGETMYVDTVENISALLSSGKATPADVAPVVHGQWIHYPDYGVTRCSHCGWSIEEYWEPNYCPDCGARMDGEESNDGTFKDCKDFQRNR